MQTVGKIPYLRTFSDIYDVIWEYINSCFLVGGVIEHIFQTT